MGRLETTDRQSVHCKSVCVCVCVCVCVRAYNRKNTGPQSH